MALIRPEQLRSGSFSITGSFTGSFEGDGSGLTGVGGDSFPYTGSAIISGSLNVVGPFTASLPEGYVWLGNAGGIATPTPTSSLAVSAILPIEDEGTEITPAVSVIDFVGNGVTATAVGNAVTITIPGGTVPLFPFVGDAVITGSLEIIGTGDDLFLIKNQTNDTILQISQSGIVVLSTQSSELNTTAPNGGIYFTSASMFVGLD